MFLLPSLLHFGSDCPLFIKFFLENNVTLFCLCSWKSTKEAVRFAPYIEAFNSRGKRSQEVWCSAELEDKWENGSL